MIDSLMTMNYNWKYTDHTYRPKKNHLLLRLMKWSEKSVHVLSRHLWLSKLGWDNSTYIEGIICPTQLE